MSRKISFLASALVIGVSLFGTPTPSRADLVTSVLVTVGTTTWCSNNLSCNHPIWNLGPTGFTVDATHKLVLSQTSGFNFDSSDLQATTTPTVAINTTTFSDTSKVLSQPNGVDPITNAHNEAVDYVSLGAVGGTNLSAFVGYADNLHTDQCADPDHNCLPEPLIVSANAMPTVNTVANFPTSGFANHCDPSTTATTATCWDGGVIEIELSAVPEPTTMLLVGTAGLLVGLGTWGRRHLRKIA